MAVTVESFKAANTAFDGRRDPAIQAAIDEAKLSFSADVCGDLYDPLVMAQARVILLQDPNGLPTSATKESNLVDDAINRLQKLKRLVPVRGLGTRSDCE